jgi:hypothetical protein
VRLDAEASRKRYEAETAQARVAVAQTESMYKSERAQWVTSLDAQKFEVRANRRSMAAFARASPVPACCC